MNHHIIIFCQEIPKGGAPPPQEAGAIAACAGVITGFAQKSVRRMPRPKVPSQ
jgi:hypothetical protein